MSHEANENARKILAEWLKRHGPIANKDSLDDLHGRIATALDESWQQGMADVKTRSKGLDSWNLETVARLDRLVRDARQKNLGWTQAELDMLRDQTTSSQERGEG